MLSCALDLNSGKAITIIHARMNSAGFCELLGQVRAHYKHKPVWMLLDSGSLHTSAVSRKTARLHNIELVMLPRQCSELNAVDHLWRSVKSDVCSNYQYESVAAHAQAAFEYVEQMTPLARLRRAGVLAPQFWLKDRL